MKDWLYKVLILDSTLGVLKEGGLSDISFNQSKWYVKILIYLSSSIIRLMISWFHWIVLLINLFFALLKTFLIYDANDTNLIDILNILSMDYNIEINGIVLTIMIYFICLHLFYMFITLLVTIISNIISLTYYGIKALKK